MIMENTRELNGKYEVNIWNNGNVAYFRKDAGDLFEINGKANVLVYVDRDIFENDDSLDMYLAVSLSKEFNVVISTEYDSSLAKGADIVINRFNNINKVFLNDLAEYDDGSRLFVNDKSIRSIGSERDFKEFVREMRKDLVSRTYVVDGNRKEELVD